MIREARARLRDWWRPTLTIPARPDPDPPLSGLEGLFGYAEGRQVVIVTPRGTEIPIPAGCQMPVLVFQRLLAQIDSLPEIEPRRFTW